MFRFRGLDVITLFHSPSVPASAKTLSLLKQASAVASSSTTIDQASDNWPQAKSNLQTEFELDVTEDQPTPDQLKSIIEYVGPQRAHEIVQGARDEADALARWKADGGSFVRPLTVDWNNGKAVAGPNESAILKMLAELPRK